VLERPGQVPVHGMVLPDENIRRAGGAAVRGLARAARAGLARAARKVPGARHRHLHPLQLCSAAAESPHRRGSRR
ncbi:MAG: hypothetical protein ACK559_23615, partial [bacterium]